MYPEIKSYAIDETEARAVAGDEKVDEVLGVNCEFTNRVINDCYEVVEMSASVDFVDKDGDERILKVLYLVDKKEALETDDLGNLDYSNYTFTID